MNISSYQWNNHLSIRIDQNWGEIVIIYGVKMKKYSQLSQQPNSPVDTNMLVLHARARARWNTKSRQNMTSPEVTLQRLTSCFLYILGTE